MRNRTFLINPYVYKIERVLSKSLNHIYLELLKYLKENENKRIVKIILKSRYYQILMKSIEICRKHHMIVEWSRSEPDTLLALHDFFCLREDQIKLSNVNVNIQNILHLDWIEELSNLTKHSEYSIPRVIIPYILSKIGR